MRTLHALDLSRPFLYAVAAIGLFGVNAVFLYYAFFQPDVMWAAYRNPVSAAFIAEAFVLMFFAAWLVARVGWQRPGWKAFIALSLVGSLAFSVPVFLLLHLRKDEAHV